MWKDKGQQQDKSIKLDLNMRRSFHIDIKISLVIVWR